MRKSRWKSDPGCAFFPRGKRRHLCYTRWLPYLVEKPRVETMEQVLQAFRSRWR